LTLQRPLLDNAHNPVSAPPDHESDGAARWVCVACRSANPIDLDVCAGCGVSFGSLLRDDTPSPAVAARGVLGVVREAGLVAGLFVLWKVASSFSLMHESGAFSRGRWIWNLERTLRLPNEASVQAPVLAHPVVVQALNVFYLAAHIGGMAVFLPWLFFSHREHYRRWRNVVVAFTGLSLLIQFVSVAPPRLLPKFGLVDTAARYHQSAYQDLGPGLVGQLSSMPSIHVGWAVIIALAVIASCHSRWRWLIVAHPLVTTYAVIATANHFWLDAVAAAGLVGLVLAGFHIAAGRSRSARVAQAGPMSLSCELSR